ncbi:MAG: nicotinate-nucleotide adenylyltransferase [Gammaproteobacteria bacterium]
MIAILGGTFDPVHYGHLRTAIEVKTALGIDEIFLLPGYIPPHRDAPAITAEQRLALLSLAIAPEPGLAIDDRELQRKGPSYMVDTLVSLREQVGNEPVSLVLGVDAFNQLDQWHHWEKITDLAHLIIMTRPDYELPQEGTLGTFFSQRQVTELARLHDEPAGLIVSLSVTRLDISSTKIRQLIAAGMSIRYLLPDTVLDKIKQEGWYLHQ